MTSAWTETFDATFWLAMGTIFSGIIAMCLKSCYQSKCKHISVCGVVIDRDVRAEINSDALTLPPTPTTPQPQTQPLQQVQRMEERNNVQLSNVNTTIYSEDNSSCHTPSAPTRTSLSTVATGFGRTPLAAPSSMMTPAVVV